MKFWGTCFNPVQPPRTNFNLLLQHISWTVLSGSHWLVFPHKMSSMFISQCYVKTQHRVLKGLINICGTELLLKSFRLHFGKSNFILTQIFVRQRNWMIF